MTDELIEQVARIIDPSSWRVMDSEKASMLRKYKGRNIGWPSDQFQHKESMAKASAILAAINPHARLEAARIEALTAENERLRAALQEPHWFYLGDDCSSDQCRFGIDECISEDFEWDNPAKGDHVLQISGARPVPDMWIALHYFTDAEKDERDDDEPYAYTVHATEEAARAALAGSAEQ